jgi:hypothetical protein
MQRDFITDDGFDITDICQCYLLSLTDSEDQPAERRASSASMNIAGTSKPVCSVIS